ncbi:hypothetical protein [Endozoicomonas lisbonensis]|uniref:Uncharacterized protein n=1 Tax=Endozoicomonas lisbonensis TaxID=3120522 RepID=A0ABV2SF48_9GAMM
MSAFYTLGQVVIIGAIIAITYIVVPGRSELIVDLKTLPDERQDESNIVSARYLDKSLGPALAEIQTTDRIYLVKRANNIIIGAKSWTVQNNGFLKRSRTLFCWEGSPKCYLLK